MLGRFRRAMNYWMFAISHPGYVLEFSQKDLHRVRISFYIIFVFALMYSFTSLILFFAKRTPIYEPWLKFIPIQEWFLYQGAWTLPWMILVYLSIAGTIYLFTCIASKEAYFEDALLISSLSIAIPYLMFWWIPETFIVPAFGPGNWVAWPELFELQRKFIFPGIWQIAFIAFGMRKTNNTNRLICLAAGIASVLVLVGLWLPYMR